MRGDRHHFRDIFNHMPELVFAHKARAGFTHQLAVETFLQAFNTLSINVRKADKICRHMTCGIETAGFFAQINPREIKIIDPLRLLRRDLARQINKTASWIAVNTFSQRAE